MTDPGRDTFDGHRRAARQYCVAFGRFTVGDRHGLVVFLATALFLGALWRLGIFITDSVTVANVMANAGDLRLAVVESPYSITAGSQPGLVEVGNALYGRNYGQVYLALPVLWGLELADLLVDLRLLLAAAWSLGTLALARTVATIRETPRLGHAGAVIALGTFAIALLIATPISPNDRPIIALQITTILVTAVGATALYRLSAWAHGPRVGLAAGVAVVVATPLGFWGSLPKRHAIIAATLLVATYWFATSRDGGARWHRLRRAGAYGALAFLAAVHPFEAVFALTVFVPLDVLTAPRIDGRTVAVVAVALLVGLAPFLATNAVITGDPLEPPNVYPDAPDGSLQPAPGSTDSGGGMAAEGGSDGGSGGGTGDGGGSGDGGGGLPIDALLALLSGLAGHVAWVGGYMTEYLTAGLAAATELDRLVHVFVRSGWIPGIRYHYNAFETVELALLESLPLAAGLLAVPVLVADRVHTRWGDLRSGLNGALGDPIRQTDALAAAFSVTFVLIYMPMLPNNSLLTLRYIVPAVPLLVYGLVRLAPVRTSIAEAPGVLVASFSSAFVLLGLGTVTILAALHPAVGEAVQFHALVGLATAAVAALSLVTWPGHRRPAIVAAGLGVPAGATTLYLVFASLVYFRYGDHALDLVRLVAETLPAVG